MQSRIPFRRQLPYQGGGVFSHHFCPATTILHVIVFSIVWAVLAPCIDRIANVKRR
jgi:hypothetical protein